MEAKRRYTDRTIAGDYNEDRFGGEFGSWLRQREVDLYASLLDDRPESVLDVGAGTGKLSLPLVHRTGSLTSSDFAPEMLRIARDQADVEGLPIRFVVADAQNLCFADGSFDTVVSSRMLMHVPQWRKGLAELVRAARNTVIFDFPPTSSFAAVDVVIKKLKAPFVPGTWTHKTIRTGHVRRELERHGFRVVEMRKDWFLPVALHRRLDRPRLSRQLEELCAFLGLRRLFGAPVTIKAVRVPSVEPAPGASPHPAEPRRRSHPSGPPDGRTRETQEVEA